MKLVGYARVSTTKQVEGTSLKSQKEKIEAYCKENGHELVHLFADEGLSGKRGSKRPQYDNLLKRLVDDPEVQGVIISALSRLGRSLPDVLNMIWKLDDEKRVFISLKEHFDMTTKEGRLFIGIVASVNQYERELIIERMEEGREYAELHGSRSGKPCHRPKREINWSLVEMLRKQGASWGSITKALAQDPNGKVAKSTLISQAKERGMKIE
jgi:DNA invertase Pin-like site-specific DNA recombinase